MSDARPRVAVVQAAPIAFETSHTIAKLEQLTLDAADQGAELVVFPEAFVGGYPKGADFGARVGLRRAEGRAWFSRYFDGAIELPGPELERLGRIAQEARVYLVAGVIERAGGTLYCTAIHLDRDGRYLGKHRKVMPTAMERLIWGFGDGSTLAAVESPWGRIGTAICWENYMPALRLNLYSQQVAIYCAPTVDDREVWQASMRHIAVEGRCFVLAAAQFTRRSDYPADYECIQGDDPECILIRGGSVIVDPFGEVLAGPVYGEETILFAELDLSRIAQGKYDLDVSGHYARPDIFSLAVNRSPQDPVRSSD
ncbi:MAG: carbon-nitrogen hydrolase family protein [Xanthomonadales bacterium]|nr:carbon-nitrogen hydrolase family protein [Xanthomonadales bacterium]